MSRVDVIMPQMGESIAEGTVSKWLKQVGDQVKRDEPILEISTDKVDAEIPSPASGVLTEIKVEEGKTVEVQTVVAVIETDGKKAESGRAGERESVEKAARAEKAEKAEKAERAEKAEEVEREERPAASAAPPVPAAPSAAAPTGDGKTGAEETQEDRLRSRSTPLVRKIAAEHDVDISRIEGTGYAGRVTKKDILSYIESGAAEVPTSPGLAPGVRRAPPESGAPAAVFHPEVEAWPGDEVVPMSRIRRLTADHMVASRRIAAHVVSYYEIDYSRIAAIRKAKKKEFQERGVNLTFLAFITKVIADNLRKHKVVNASVSGDKIIYRKPINVGIAVALEWGLIVPVIRNADELSLLGLSKKIVDLAERARSKKLTPDEVQQGTFTITNPGVFGSWAGDPIINQPQVAILGVGAIEKRPRVFTLDDGQDVIAIRTMGMLTLAYDHRIVDGADADRFMADVKHDLENFAEGAA